MKMKKNILRIFSIIFIFSIFFNFGVEKIAAQTAADSTTSQEESSNSIFGEIEAPAGVSELNDQSEGGVGLLLFISNIIKLISIVAGIFVLFNFVSAGFTYITANGDSGAYSKIGEKLSLSVTGLLLIVASYTIAGIIGLIVFGDATYIISPDIPTVN